jgi:glutathione synthase/RimK-type ligase-like ATP-grasp enzyme
VINGPERIAHLSRDGFCATLDGVPRMLVPRTVRMDREAAMQLTDEGFPLIVRPVDSHAGTDLQKVDDAVALRDYLAARPAGAFYLAPFVDYSGPDGQFRKYRIVLVDGKPFICHLAISSHWMVHYLNAGMDDSAAKRAEEAAGMAGFDEGFARRHEAALAEIDARVGLPWLGIDCAETRDGRLLVFEVDNAMVVHAMDDPVRYPYKGPAMAKVFTGFERMVQLRRD